ncbi:MAG: DUF4430 domain-containing protein [Lachnospiraceae bacterium]|nr:DUF4430 domain-containing protein [Lachnospiraceae bacterium]
MKRKTVNKIITVVLAAALLLSLSACGKTIGTGGDKPAGGVVQVTGSASDNSTSNKETKDSKDASAGTTSASENTTGQQTNAGGNPSGGNAAGTGTAVNTGTNTNTGYDTSAQPAQPATEAPTQPPTEAPTQPPAPTWTISVTVDGGAYGGVFGGGTFTFYYQPTAFDALTATGLAYTGSSDYVRSINGLAEFDHGRMSGWLYAVNGYEPGVGCGSYYLNDGDYVYWHYQGDE